jgi:hypothetical protein
MYNKMHAIRILVMSNWKEKRRRNCALEEFKAALESTRKKKDSK